MTLQFYISSYINPVFKFYNYNSFCAITRLEIVLNMIVGYNYAKNGD